QHCLRWFLEPQPFGDSRRPRMERAPGGGKLATASRTLSRGVRDLLGRSAFRALRSGALRAGPAARRGIVGIDPGPLRTTYLAVPGGHAAAVGGRAPPPWPLAQFTRRGDRHRENCGIRLRLPAPGA